MTESTRRLLIKKAQGLCRALERERRINAELREANANLRVERDTADILLGEAMDAVLGAK
jgi:hypothetical protein